MDSSRIEFLQHSCTSNFSWMILSLVTLSLLSGDAYANSPPSPSVSWRTPLRNENFDKNMVIILATFLCALVFTLGLKSILRCCRRTAFDVPHEAMGHYASTGLKKSELGQIPVTLYGPGASIPATDCPICLGEFMDGEVVRVLPKCNHGYHVRCIDTWLMSHSSCPTCRRSLVDRPLPDSVEMEADNRSPENESGRPGGVVVVIGI